MLISQNIGWKLFKVYDHDHLWKGRMGLEGIL